MPTEKTIVLTRWTFVGKVMSLLFNMLSRLLITFLPRNKHLLISWLQSPSTVILEPKKIKSVIVSTVSQPSRFSLNATSSVKPSPNTTIQMDPHPQDSPFMLFLSFRGFTATLVLLLINLFRFLLPEVFI